MPTEVPSPLANHAPRVNVADRLTEHAQRRPDAVAVVAIQGLAQRKITFAELDRDANCFAHGLVAMGVRPGHRLALLVKPGIEFVALVFALLRSGATMVLVDGGLGRKNIVRCLESTQPDGFIAIPPGHALRVLMGKKFADAKFNVTVGRRWFWGGQTLASLRNLGAELSPSPTGGGARGGGTRSAQENNPEPNNSPSPGPSLEGPSLEGRGNHGLPQSEIDHSPAAIVFTSGSTGPPKGVVYRHETFATQCEQIQQQYDLQPGAVDLACFPLFGLFNVACGVTTVLPEMDFSRPASCDSKKLFVAANRWQVTQSFASPAVWDRLSRHAEQTGQRIPTLKKVFSCGAPVPARVIRRTLAMVHPDAQLHTPYGATEALPVATIEAQEILNETGAKTDTGAGVCVGRKFDVKGEGGRRKAEEFQWRVIRITDDPIASIDEAEELPQGEIGELIVRGPQVSRRYLNPREPQASAPGVNPKPTHNQQAKIQDGDTVWHRMGDVGYFDDQERFWYCGRKSQRVVTTAGTLYTECVEQLCNTVDGVFRTALVGVRRDNGVEASLIVESDLSWAPWETNWDDIIPFLKEQGLDSKISHVLLHDSLPTDIRHNSKIRREELAVWAAKKLAKKT